MNYVIDQIKTLIKAGLGTQVRYYYIGRPHILPNNVTKQGYIAIVPIQDETELVQTQTDLTTYTIRIHVGKDVRNEWNKLPEKVGTTQWLTNIVQGTDTNGNLKTDTIKYILRKNLTSIGKTHVLGIEYLDVEVEEQYVKEAQITLQVTTTRGLI